MPHDKRQTRSFRNIPQDHADPRWDTFATQEVWDPEAAAKELVARVQARPGEGTTVLDMRLAIKGARGLAEERRAAVKAALQGDLRHLVTHVARDEYLGMHKAQAKVRVALMEILSGNASGLKGGPTPYDNWVRPEWYAHPEGKNFHGAVTASAVIEACGLLLAEDCVAHARERRAQLAAMAADGADQRAMGYLGKACGMGPDAQTLFSLVQLAAHGKLNERAAAATLATRRRWEGRLYEQREWARELLRDAPDAGK